MRTKAHGVYDRWAGARIAGTTGQGRMTTMSDPETTDEPLVLRVALVRRPRGYTVEALGVGGRWWRRPGESVWTEEELRGIRASSGFDVVVREGFPFTPPGEGE